MITSGVQATANILPSHTYPTVDIVTIAYLRTRREVGFNQVVVWCGVVWCGVVWCDVVWCGVVWCGVDASCGVV